MPKKILSQTTKKLKRNQQPRKPKPKNNRKKTPKKKKLKRAKLNFELKKIKKQ
jgi:hypothetical protein